MSKTLYDEIYKRILDYHIDAKVEGTIGWGLQVTDKAAKDLVALFENYKNIDDEFKAGDEVTLQIKVGEDKVKPTDATFIKFQDGGVIGRQHGTLTYWPENEIFHMRRYGDHL